MIEELSKDHASACFRAGARGGAGGAAIAPVPSVPAAGYGSAELEFCRSNEPGSEIEIKPDGTLTIKHGAGGMDALKDRLDTLEAAIKFLIQQMATPPSAPDKPTIF